MVEPQQQPSKQSLKQDHPSEQQAQQPKQTTMIITSDTFSKMKHGRRQDNRYSDIDKLERDLREIAADDDSVYQLNNFGEYPSEMTSEDRLVFQIILGMHPEKTEQIQGHVSRLQAEIDEKEDRFQMDETVSSMAITSQFKSYKSSLTRFHCSAEQFFQLLEMRNSRLEVFEEEVKQMPAKPQLERFQSMNGVSLLKKVPIELKIMILQFAGPSGFFKMQQLSTEWSLFCSPKQQSKIKRQALKYMLRHFCLQMWPQPKFKTTRNFLNSFTNWREMLKMRPLVRYDGIYRCKMKYLKDGLSWTSEYNPIHEVISYKYVRFMRSGQTLSIQTVHAPKKIFSKLKQCMVKSQLGLGKSFVEPWSGELQIHSGTFEVYNDTIRLMQPVNATEYRYDFKAFRKSQLPSYRQDDEGDHLCLDWQGFRIDENQISPGQIQLLSDAYEKAQHQAGSYEEFTDKTGFLSMKFKSVLDPQFKFLKVHEFDMPHNYYVEQLRQMTGQFNDEEEEEKKQ